MVTSNVNASAPEDNPPTVVNLLDNDLTSITSLDNGISENVITLPVTLYAVVGCCIVPLILTRTPAVVALDEST